MRCLGPDGHGGFKRQARLLCSGRSYYDLDGERRRATTTTTAILRLEQLLSIPRKQLADQVALYSNASEICCTGGASQ